MKKTRDFHFIVGALIGTVVSSFLFVETISGVMANYGRKLWDFLLKLTLFIFPEEILNPFLIPVLIVAVILIFYFGISNFEEKERHRRIVGWWLIVLGYFTLFLLFGVLGNLLHREIL